MANDLTFSACDVFFECPICHDYIKSSVGLPDTKMMERGTESVAYGHGFFDLQCTECHGSLLASVEVDGAHIDVQLAHHPDTLVHTEETLLYTALSYPEPPPANPWERFVQATDQIKLVMDQQGSSSDGTHIVNRMVFAQYISAFEAYLAETLIRNIEADPAAISKLVAVDPHLKSKRFGLSEIIEDPNIVRKEVRSYLRGVIYHRLSQVDGLYRQALNIRILKDKADSSALMQAIAYRHDCIHRNGFDQDGKLLQVFTPGYIEEIAAILTVLVGRVEASIQFKSVTPIV